MKNTDLTTYANATMEKSNSRGKTTTTLYERFAIWFRNFLENAE